MATVALPARATSPVFQHHHSRTQSSAGRSLNKMPSQYHINTAGANEASSSSCASAASTPVPPTPIANKLATPSTYSSLYQKCIIIRERWARVPGFPEAFLDADAPFAPDSHDPNLPIDPVSVVCHCLRLGASLCFLFNALHLPVQLDINREARPTNISACKKSAAHFLMAVKKELDWSDNDLFMIKQLYEQDTNGVVRVVDCVLKLLGELEARGLLLERLDLPESDKQAVTALDDRGKVVREILSTERDYVAALEILQCYKQELTTHDVISRDMIHRIFLNLDQLLDFQQRFLIGVEAHADQPPENQRFGHLILSMEANFSVYESYCSNFLAAQNLVEELKPVLTAFQQQQQAKSQNGQQEMSRILDPNMELPSQLIKPVQRICKYPLLLMQLVKVSDADSPHREELEQGLEAIKRVTDKVNENKRRQENEEAVQELGRRVEDWKGHDVNTFGPLLLEDTFFVIKNDNDREYHVYLFERIILCCKEASATGKKGTKSNSLINRKAAGKKPTSLQLKGRIFINNVVEAAQVGPALLQVTWKGDAGQECFSIKCRTDEILKQWQKTIAKAVEDVHSHRRSRASQGLRSRINSPNSQFPNTPISEMGTPSIYSSHGSEYGLPPYNRTSHGSFPPNYGSSHGNVNVFDQEAGDYIDGRSTPSGRARGQGYTQSLPPGMRPIDDSVNGRPRAQTEDSTSAMIQQWRSHTPAMPNLPRGTSISSAASDASSSLDGARPLRNSAGSKVLKHKQSHEWGSAGFTRMPNWDEEVASNSGSTPTQRMSSRNPSQANLPPGNMPPMLQTRNRSASSPHVYQINSGTSMSRHGSHQSQADQYLPNVPNVPPLNLLARGKGNMSTATLQSSASASTNDRDRRFSSSSMGSHRSSGDSSQSQIYTATSSPGSALPPKLPPIGADRHYGSEPTTVRIKIRLGADAFVIAAVASINYKELVDRVLKKIRHTCPEKHFDERTIKMRYADEDDDKILISSDEDITLAIEGAKISSQSGSASLTIYLD